MVTKAARRAHHDMRPPVQRALFGAVIHAAHTSGDLRAGTGIKPLQLARHLQGQLARGRNDQRHRRIGIQQLVRPAQHLVGNRDAKGHRLARTGLRRNQQVAPLHALGQNGNLHRGQRDIPAPDQCRGQRPGDTHIDHVFSQRGCHRTPMKCPNERHLIPFRNPASKPSAPEPSGREPGQYSETGALYRKMIVPGGECAAKAGNRPRK